MEAVKAKLRAECAARRARRHERSDAGTGARLAEQFLAALAPPPDRIISGYWPIRDEIDVRPLLARLAARGHRLALPVTVAPGQPLIFRAWRAGDRLEAGSFGTMTPSPRRAEVTPALLIVPLLAFDDGGRRLGYGGGYYDRTLAVLKPGGALAVGVAYEDQRLARLPESAHDQRLDWVVTELRARRTGGAG